MKDGWYTTDGFSNKAVDYIGQYAGRPEPFLLYLAYTAPPHWPLHALPEDISKYKGKYMKGWDTLREERHARMIEQQRHAPRRRGATVMGSSAARAIAQGGRTRAYTPSLLTYDANGIASFTVSSFSGYAVTAAVPEPGTMGLLALAGVMMLGRRRERLSPLRG